MTGIAGLGQKLIGLKAVAGTVAGAIAPIFEEGMNRQTAEVNFATLLGAGKSKEEAAQIGKQFATDLRNSTAATLYGTSTVNDAAKNMIAFGIDGDKTKTVLAQIGDIAAGDAQKFGSLSLAFAQISSAGKLQGQDLMQLINAGFNPLAEISKKTGKNFAADGVQATNGTSTPGNTNDDLVAAVNGGTGGTGSLKKSTKDKTEAVVNGGTRNTTVNISIGDMVKEINFNGGLNQNANELETQLSELMVRVFYTAAQFE